MLRAGRGGQDHRLGHLRPPGRPPRATSLRGDGGPGPSAGRLPRRGLPAQHPGPRARGLAGRALRPHARYQGDLRRPGRPLLGDDRPGRFHPDQPHLPEPGRGALGHPGVHGHGEALRAGRGRPFRPGGGGHAAHPQRPRPARRPPPVDPVPREPHLPGPDGADPGLPAGGERRRPGPAADHLEGRRGRDRRGRHGLLQGLLGHGGGVPLPGDGGAGPARPAQHGLRARDQPAARRGGGGGVLRLPAGRDRGAHRPPWW